MQKPLDAITQGFGENVFFRCQIFAGRKFQRRPIGFIWPPHIMEICASEKEGKSFPFSVQESLLV